MNISDESLVVLLLCSQLSIPDGGEIKPLNLPEWNALTDSLNHKGLRTDSLLGMNDVDLSEHLNLSGEKKDRITALLKQDESLIAALDKLDSLGIWVLTRADQDYPKKYIERLNLDAPVILYGVGDKNLINDPGFAIVGSRDVDADGEQFASNISNAAAYAGLVIFSGGAKGVDQISMRNALIGRGSGVGVLASSLTRAVKSKKYRGAIADGSLCLYPSTIRMQDFKSGSPWHATN